MCITIQKLNKYKELKNSKGEGVFKLWRHYLMKGNTFVKMWHLGERVNIIRQATKVGNFGGVDEGGHGRDVDGEVYSQTSCRSYDPWR